MHTCCDGQAYSLVVAEMCTASALISIGTVLGKTNPVQLTVIALLEVAGFVLNEWLLRRLLRVFHFCVSHDILFVHAGNGNVKVLLMTSGAAPEQHHAASYFWPLFWTHARLDPVSEGIGAAFWEGEISLQNGTFLNVGYSHTCENTKYSNCFSKEPEQENHVPPGSVFIWVFWPSFNSILMEERSPERDLEVASSTYLALAASAVAAAAVAVLLNPKGKLSLVRYSNWNEHSVRLWTRW